MGEDTRAHLDVLAKVQSNYARFLREQCPVMGIELTPEQFRDVVYSMTDSLVDAIEEQTGDKRFSEALKDSGLSVIIDEDTGEIIGHGSP